MSHPPATVVGMSNTVVQKGDYDYVIANDPYAAQASDLLDSAVLMLQRAVENRSDGPRIAAATLRITVRAAELRRIVTDAVATQYAQAASDAADCADYQGKLERAGGFSRQVNPVGYNGVDPATCVNRPGAGDRTE